MAAERESWGNHCEFFLSSLGLAVGLGNVWRFPYVCYTNGGGSFIIPYLVMLVLVGLPAFFLELSLGQYSRVGANKVFGRMVPAFNGLGYAMVFVRFLVNIYYVVITAWALFYLAIGMQKNLPWGSCEESWNTYDCYSISYENECKKNLGVDFTYYKKNCTTIQEYCMEHGYETGSYITGCLKDGSSTAFKDVVGEFGVSPAEDYFNGRVLGINKDESGLRYNWDDYGSIQGHLVGCLAAAWVLVCLILLKGLQSYGKVAYVITLSPYFVLTALLIYSVLLDGATDGISYLMDPDWDKLTDIKIWNRAASQILFSLSVGFGSQLVLSSYNNFRNNSHRDSIIVGLCNSLTSLYAGVVVFLILGFLAKNLQTDVDKVVKGGISLAFVSYPSAVLEMDVSPLWSFLFFFMLINLALSSICGGVQTFLAFVIDEKPSLAKYRSYIVIGLCCMFFLAGLPMTTNGGILLFTVFDKRCTSSLLFLCLLEIVHVAWFYGTGKFFENLAEMNMEFNSGLRLIWTFAWRFLTPVVLAFITVYAWVDHTPMAYDAYEFPAGIEALGWIMELMPFLIVLLYPLIPLKKAYDDGLRGKELLNEIFSPTDKWYSAQMDRRQAEIQAAEDAKYYHHNLGYDNEEYMQGSMQLEKLGFKKDDPKPPPVDEILEAPPVMEEKPKLPPAYEVIDADPEIVEEPSDDIFKYVPDVRDLDEPVEEKVEVEVHSESSAEQEVIEHFEKTVESLDDNIEYESDNEALDDKTSDVQSEQGEVIEADVIYDVIEDTKKSTETEESGLDHPPVKIVIDEAPDTREASMIVHDPIDRDSLHEDEESEIVDPEPEVQVEEAPKVESLDQNLESDPKPETQDANPKVESLAEQAQNNEVFKSKLSQTLQNLPNKSYLTEPDIVIEEKN